METMIVKTQRLFDFVQPGDLPKLAADLPVRQRGRPAGEVEPDEPELQNFGDLRLTADDMERFLEIRQLRRTFHPSGCYAVAWKPNGETCRGDWTGRSGVKTLSFEAVARICDHMDEMARRRREAIQDAEESKTAKKKKPERAKRTSPLFPDTDVD